MARPWWTAVAFQNCGVRPAASAGGVCGLAVGDAWLCAAVYPRQSRSRRLGDLAAVRRAGGDAIAAVTRPPAADPAAAHDRRGGVLLRADAFHLLRVRQVAAARRGRARDCATLLPDHRLCRI